MNKLKLIVYKLFNRKKYKITKTKLELEKSIQNLKKNNKHIGKNTKIYPQFQISNSSIGDYTYIAQNSIINNTTIGKFCSVGPNLISGWGLHPTNGISTHPMFYSTKKQNGMTLSETDKFEELKPIIIGNDVFIGMNVSILDGVTIGDGAVIGAGAVVSKDIPSYAIAVGCPIQIKGYRFDEETIQKFIGLQWWDFDKIRLNEIEQNFFNFDDWLSKSEAL